MLSNRLLILALFVFTITETAFAQRFRIGRVTEVLQAEEVVGNELCLEVKRNILGTEVTDWIPARRRARGIFWIQGRAGRRKKTICERLFVETTQRTSFSTDCFCAPDPTLNVDISGNLNLSGTDMELDRLVTGGDLRATAAGGALDSTNTVTYTELETAADLNGAVTVYDALGEPHVARLFFFKDDDNVDTWVINGYVNSEEVDPLATVEFGEPRILGTTTVTFTSSAVSTGGTFTANNLPWNNGAATTQSIDFDFTTFISVASPSVQGGTFQDGTVPTRCPG